MGVGLDGLMIVEWRRRVAFLWWAFALGSALLAAEVVVVAWILRLVAR